tara:strand:+ start:562 stop:681 length:120 start_codon:yes stop_codon:yes gene_type:complete
MPFKSKKQQAYLYANKPKVAEKFAKHSKSAKMTKGYKTK